jgi:hypothetical protein
VQRWLVALALATTAACFSPTYPDNLPCDPDGWCPPGQACAAGNVCVRTGGTPGSDAGAGADAVVTDAGGLGDLLSISIGGDLTLAVAETHQFVITGTYERGTEVITGFAVWDSTDNLIVRVDFMGLATAESPGTATVRARYEGRVATAIVEVVPAP